MALHTCTTKKNHYHWAYVFLSNNVSQQLLRPVLHHTFILTFVLKWSVYCNCLRILHGNKRPTTARNNYWYLYCTDILHYYLSSVYLWSQMASAFVCPRAEIPCLPAVIYCLRRYGFIQIWPKMTTGEAIVSWSSYVDLSLDPNVFFIFIIMYKGPITIP